MNVFVSSNADNTSKAFKMATLQDKPELVRQIARALEDGGKVFASWCTQVGGTVVSITGDQVTLEVPAHSISELSRIRETYASAIHGTTSIGIGVSLNEADKALKVAKKRGKDRILFWSDDMQEELNEKSREDKEDKLAFLKEKELSKATPPPSTPNKPPEPPQGQAPANEAPEENEGEAEAEGEEAPPPPETPELPQEIDGDPQTHEDFFRQHADISQAKEDSGKDPGRQKVKEQVVEILQQVKQMAPQMEQLKDQAPELYEAIKATIQAMGLMAGELSSGDGEDKDEGGGAPPDEGEENPHLPGRHYLKLPVGTVKNGKMKIANKDGTTSWVSVRSGIHKSELGEEAHRILMDNLTSIAKAVAKADSVPTREHLNLPVGSQVDGKIKVQHDDGKTGWVGVRSGKVMSNDETGHPVSSRNPNGK